MLSRHMALTLSTDDRVALQRRVRSHKLRAEDARRARETLTLALGDEYEASEGAVPLYPYYINGWPRRLRSMKRPRFKPWLGWTPCCHSRRGAPSVTGSSTTGTGPCPCSPPPTRGRAKSWGRRYGGTRVPRLSTSWPTSSPRRRA